jgi:RING finger protein 113A
MFRKPKRKVKAALRNRNEDNHNDDKNEEGRYSEENAAAETATTTDLIDEARKRLKQSSAVATAATSQSSSSSSAIMPQYDLKSTTSVSASLHHHRDLVTSTAEHHPVAASSTTSTKPTEAITGLGEDGIFRDKKRNLFHAGPIRAATNVRTTARFDYQPDICKDYKETGFCGYGDTCIYLHDRTDTLSGWQIEKNFEEQQKKLQEAKQLEAFALGNVDHQTSAATTNTDTANGNSRTEDGIPFACFLCRGHFRNPVVTNCQHYFCESCILDHTRQQPTSTSTNNNNHVCPICQKDTGGVFNAPTKLIAKKRKILGKSYRENHNTTTEDESLSWQRYFEALAPK